MNGAMEQRLVWLPFSPESLGELPAGLRCEQVDPREGVPASSAEVRFFVPPYLAGPTIGQVLGEFPRLEVVQTLTAGVETIRPFVPPGVTLCNGRGIHDTATAELALTLTLTSLNRMTEFAQAQHDGAWRPAQRTALADHRVLIVGHGQIGAAIEARLRPFETEVVRVARRARDGVHPIEDLPGLLPQADVVILIVPGTAETTGLFDAELLALMQDGALLVNVARGPVVDTDALVAELRTGRLHAALDVTDPEPLPVGHPLWSAPNLVLTPHVGGFASSMWPRAHRIVREQLLRYASGAPLSNVMTGDY